MRINLIAQMYVVPNSFKMVDGFVNIYEKQIDDNGFPYSVIKVKTANIDNSQRRELNFQGDYQSSLELEYKDGEVWVFITYMTSYIKITHSKYGSCVFNIPFDLVPKCGYEMLLVNPIIENKGWGSLKIKTRPEDGATIEINGKKILKTTPYYNNMIAAGAYDIKITKDKYKPETRTINIIDGTIDSLDIEMCLGFSDLVIKTEPEGVGVIIDGKKCGNTPLFLNDIAYGDHKICLMKDNYYTINKVFSIEDDKCFEINEKMSECESKAYSVNGVTFEMMAVKGGTFNMGCDNKKNDKCYDDGIPEHTITLKDYYIGKFEVTQDLWVAVMGYNPSHFIGDRLPVDNISWDDCQKFLKKLNKKTKEEFRLPTEAEWEYAARGGVNTFGYIYSGEDKLDSVAWFCNNSGDKKAYIRCVGEMHYIIKNNCMSHPVGQKYPNELGIYDMSGNVWEWCYDIYCDYNDIKRDTVNKDLRVMRGGCWHSLNYQCESDYRNNMYSDYKDKSFGFRIVVGDQVKNKENKKYKSKKTINNEEVAYRRCFDKDTDIDDCIYYLSNYICNESRCEKKWENVFDRFDELYVRRILLLFETETQYDDIIQQHEKIMIKTNMHNSNYDKDIKLLLLEKQIEVERAASDNVLKELIKMGDDRVDRLKEELDNYSKITNDTIKNMAPKFGL